MSMTGNPCGGEDVDGDGADDLLLGTYPSDPGASVDAGSAYVFLDIGL
jgi:hypothetical protein